MRLLIIGGGFMGNALRTAWANYYDIVVIDPVADHCLRSLTELNESYTPDVIILAVKPQMMFDVLPPYVTRFTHHATIWVSIAAGLSTDSLHAAGILGGIVRCMPNMPVAYHEGAAGLYTNVTCADEKQSLMNVITPLFDCAGKSVWIDNEQLMDAVTAISGSGPAYFYLMVESLTHAGITQGLTADQAANLARQTLIGAGAVMKNSTDNAQTLRHQVTSKGGTTHAALETFTHKDAFQKLVDAAVHAAVVRGKELRTD